MKYHRSVTVGLNFYIILNLLILSLPTNAQKSLFVRVYNSSGIKTQKGFVLSLTDTSLTLENGSNKNTISIKDIDLIKTKRSAGHNIIVGAIANSVVNAIIFSAFANPHKFQNWTVGNGIIFGILTGSISGALAGSLNALFKKSKTFLIQGDLQQWLNFKKFWFERNELINGLKM